MAIPIYLVSSTGGKVYSCDDAVVVNDLAALDGTGGSAFTPYILSTALPTNRTLGWYTLRKFRQRFDAPSPVTIMITPWRDDRNTGQTLTRTFTVQGVDITSTPLFFSGSSFQIYVALSGFTAPVELGNANVAFVPRRHSRGISALG